ncbi:PaaX family transcriptional regulator [Dactylosporangium matsuzakiense]|uniref:PaaX family transcriptional regulator n=1 Tax=Dactylosporangium matsuzakiense TaxID=53360 RepID=A0A9W6KWV0_9ACTN|nr:PaaX family transcriptional regulator C-terminal domain-containing protein [Dactylosporangium matsuzakiense]UWZ48486.1 PaaX family transcriptional regulator [Dactylosporangium matsuzakiense]GLL08722.1 PaaX family transcriptional regulator [Dactylosporangium matsuzakiense]
MADAFDIEEIFPDDDAAVRLPRRQSGPAPQGLALTLMADYTLRTRAWLPSAAIVALLVESGVSEAGARTAISRLARRGVLQNRREGRHSLYRLAAAAAAQLSAGGQWIVSAAAAAESWDGWWTLIAFSLPQQERSRRRELRGRLRWLGYAPLYDGLWISPHALTDPAADQLDAVAPGSLTVFRARHVEFGTVARRDPLQAWDIAAIAGDYDAFISRWRPLLPRIAAGRVGGAEAVHARTAVMDTYRRFAVLDPRLPTRLLPPGWPRPAARDLFVAVYDGLARAAEAHVRAVAARHGDGTPASVSAHTVAEILAGVAAS